MTSLMDRLRGMWERWIRLLLRCFPPGFRRTMGEELSEHYTERPPQRLGEFAWRAAGAAGDLVPAGLGARLDEVRARAGGSREPLAGGLAADVRYGLRLLVRQPVYSATVVLTLALASGLATAVFAIYDATLVRPLPFPDDGRLVSIGSNWSNVTHASVSIPEYLDYRTRARSLEAIAAYRHVSVNVTSGGAFPERLAGAAVTASFFDVLGVRPALGRVFTHAEDRAGGDLVALVGHALWQRRYGGDPALVGSTVHIDDQVVTIVGIMPRAFRFPAADTEFWLPLRIDPAAPGGRGAHNRQVIARVRRGVPLTAAREELSAIGRQLAREYPQDYPAGSGWGVSTKTLRDQLVGELTDPLRILFTAVLFVLLIAAANTSSLMLARAGERRAEFAARAALGASRVRLVRQVLLEGATVGAAGGVIALFGAELLLAAVAAGLPAAIVRPGLLALDLRVLAFAIGVTACAAAAAGAYAAFQASRVGAGDALRSGGRASAGRSARRFRSALVVVEVALAFILLIGAGLSIRSFERLLDVDPGVTVSNVTTARVSLPSTRYPSGRDSIAFYRRLLDAIQAFPGVTHAGAVSVLPLSGTQSDVNFGVEGYVPRSPGDLPNSQARFVAGDYFQALGLDLKRGRRFRDGDDPDAPFVAIVSEALARRYWPGVDPIGRRLKLWSLDDEGPWRTVVGVVGDVRHFGLADDPPPILYLPVAQFPQRTLTVVVRTEETLPVVRLIEEQVRSLDPLQPIYEPRTMDAWVDRSTAQPRFNLSMFSIFASTALALAALGIYGVIASTVVGRTRELNIRVALGAEPGTLVQIVVARGMALAGLGLGLGLAGALVLSRYLTALLYGVEPLEPIVYVSAAVALAVVALGASALPARRILTLDPSTALRAD